MAKIELHPDFKDFLRLLNSHGVEYLIVGGYAVGYHGYPRATADMDIWIAVGEPNAEKAAMVLREFGMPKEAVSKEMFLDRDKVITGASGVDFEECYTRREIIEIEGIPVNFISLEDLRANKRACGRYKDLEDLEHLP